MKVKTIMSSDLVTVSADTGLLEAASLMKENDIRHLPVVEGDCLIGLVTEGEVRGAIFPAMLGDISVQDLMVTDPMTIGPEAMLEDAARIIYRHKIGCLPVVDETGKLLGIVTVADMLAALIEVMGFLFASSRLDVVLPDRDDALEEACSIIRRNKGHLIGISLTHLRKDQSVYLFRLHKTDLKPIAQDMEQAGFSVVSRLG